MTLGLWTVAIPVLLLVWLVVLVVGYQKTDDTERKRQHDEIMKALLDGAITRAKIHALVEEIHHDLTTVP